MIKSISLKRVLAVALSLAIAFAFMPALGAGNNAKAASKVPTAISVTHSGSFERPERDYDDDDYYYYYDYRDFFQTGDVLSITYNDGSKEAYTYNYDHKKGADFYNADGSKDLEELTDLSYGIEWCDDNPKYVAGNTVYFRYYVRYYDPDTYDSVRVYSGKIPVKLVDGGQYIAINGIGYVYDPYEKYAYVMGLDRDSDAQGAVTIPAQVTFKNNKTYPVKKIVDGALAGATKMTSLTLPAGLEIIGKEAFVNTGLTAITIPNTVKAIGEHAIGFNHFYNANLGKMEYTPIPNFVITGVRGTIAEGYAKSNGIAFSDPTAEAADAALQAKMAANAKDLAELKAVSKKMKLKAKAAKKGKAKLSWKANKNVNGYVILMAKKKGKFKAIKTIKKNKVKKLTVKKLKKGKKYFFKIRSFAKVGGKKYTSPDSKVVTVKAK